MNQEIELAKDRMARVGRVPEGQPYNIRTICGYFTSWKTLLFTLIFSETHLILK
jgi:ACS family pantothenate transporter-like MFS transporter